MTVFMVETMQSQDNLSPGINPQRCLRDGFQNLRFNLDPGNRLSIELLDHGIDVSGPRRSLRLVHSPVDPSVSEFVQTSK